MALAAFKAQNAEVKREVAAVEAETEKMNLSEAEQRKRAYQLRKHMTDEEYIANLPEHHLEGYVQLGDDEKKDKETVVAEKTEEPKEEPKEKVAEDSMEELEKLEAKADKEGAAFVQRHNHHQKENNDDDEEADNEDKDQSDAEESNDDEDKEEESTEEKTDDDETEVLGDGDEKKEEAKPAKKEVKKEAKPAKKEAKKEAKK